MPRGVNKVILIGNLGDEPNVRTTTTGKTVAQISIVTNEMRRNNETGEYTEFAEWHRVVFWNKLADIAKQYLHKGSQVYIEGKLRTRSYDKDNQKHYITEIVADEMQMLGNRNTSAQGSQDSYSNRTPNTYSQQNTNSYGAPQNSYGTSATQNSYGNATPAQQFYNNANGPQGTYGNTPQAGYGSNNTTYGSQATSNLATTQQSTPVAEPQEPAMTSDDGSFNDEIPF